MAARAVVLAALALLAVGHGAESIIPNGDFAKADPKEPRKPLGWQLPDGVGAQWVDLDGGKAIRLDTALSEQAMNEAWTKAGITDFLIPKPATDPIAATYGLSFYCDPVPVEPGRAYRASCEFHGDPGGTKLWVRGFGELKGEQRRLWESVLPGNAESAKDLGGGWRSVSQIVHPTKRKADVTTVRVMLYAYWPPGVYAFRAIRLEPVDEPEPAKP
jgi:hypothetical protein